MVSKTCHGYWISNGDISIFTMIYTNIYTYQIYIYIIMITYHEHLISQNIFIITIEIDYVSKMIDKDQIQR